MDKVAYLDLAYRLNGKGAKKNETVLDFLNHTELLNKYPDLEFSLASFNHILKSHGIKALGEDALSVSEHTEAEIKAEKSANKQYIKDLRNFGWVVGYGYGASAEMKGCRTEAGRTDRAYHDGLRKLHEKAHGANLTAVHGIRDTFRAGPSYDNEHVTEISFFGKITDDVQMSLF